MTARALSAPEEDAPFFDLHAYLERIGLSAPPPATAEGLERLVLAHRLAIPFENLDIPLGRGISLDPVAIFDKLVRRRRGGYCFEQNALLSDALSDLGFSTRPLLARVWPGGDDSPVSALSHRLELVTIDGRDWIADAGFGGSWCPPMPLEEAETGFSADGARHRLIRNERFGWMLERGAPASADADADSSAGSGPEWRRQYSFTLAEAHPADREMSNHWTSTYAGSRFTSFIVVSRVLEDGFLSLTNREVRETRAGDRSSQSILDNAGALRETLDRRFDIALDEGEAERLFGFLCEQDRPDRSR